MGTEENPDQPAESVKDSTPAKESAGEASTTDESLQATPASPTKPVVPKATLPTRTVDKSTAPGKEVPAATPPAARTPGAPGASKATTTPTAAVAKGIPKPVAARATGAVVESTPDPPVNKIRRRIIWASIGGFLVTSFLMFLRFFLPRSIFEPSSVFRIGFPSDYALGVDTKYQQQYRIWVDKTSDRLFVIYARCTHLGCTPDWKASENKFKCPCHGSGYDSEGVNFEGPAPRPMDRAHVELDAEGQIVVNVGKLYDWPKGGENKFNDPGAYIPL
ncbi:MAG TPA: Rieske 2Fe-2S domain-containing protein [Pyrinomonadaceae bacterium]